MNQHNEAATQDAVTIRDAYRDVDGYLAANDDFDAAAGLTELMDRIDQEIDRTSHPIESGNDHLDDPDLIPLPSAPRRAFVSPRHLLRNSLVPAIPPLFALLAGLSMTFLQLSAWSTVGLVALVITVAASTTPWLKRRFSSTQAQVHEAEQHSVSGVPSPPRNGQQHAVTVNANTAYLTMNAEPAAKLKNGGQPSNRSTYRSIRSTAWPTIGLPLMFGAASWSAIEGQLTPVYLLAAGAAAVISLTTLLTLTASWSRSEDRRMSALETLKLLLRR